MDVGDKASQRKEKIRNGHAYYIYVLLLGNSEKNNLRKGVAGRNLGFQRDLRIAGVAMSTGSLSSH